MKVTTIVGARPQFVKAAVVSRALAQKGVDELLVHTGQHFDDNMSAVFFEEMCIPKPCINLDVHGLSPMAMIGRMMEKLEQVLQNQRPDVVLVYGDTFSTLAGALAAKQLHFPLAHVEAGLRSFNMEMPEETNRIVADRISDLLFCPSQNAVDQLLKEGIDKKKTDLCGDVMCDAAAFYASKSRRPQGDLPDKFVLCTLHRAENTDHQERLRSLMNGLESVAAEQTVCLPLHPRTKACLQEMSYDFAHSRICFMAPLSYLEMVWMLQHCSMVMTDSGGLQKEAYFFHKPCITLRNETEWVELLESGYNLLAGSDPQRILKLFGQMLQSPPKFENEALYGNGHAGERVAQKLLDFQF